jgi:CRISPR-associated endonuclease Csn1
MHNDTAYGVTGLYNDRGQMIVVTRKALSALNRKQLFDIVDPRLKREFTYATAGLTGAAFKSELIKAGKAMKPPVRRVRLATPMNEKSLITVQHGPENQHTKTYKGSANYCYDIFMGEKGRWVGQVISTFEAYKLGISNSKWWQTLLRPDGSPLMMRIRKGDMLEIDVAEGRRQVVVYKFSSGKINMCDHNEGNASERIRNGEINGYQMSPGSLQKSNAVKISVSPSGQVKRVKI